jgi:PKD repeat protein
METQTNYQMKFILSNASGISGYYAPDNVIFTNGTTRPDWYDVNATDGSNTPLPFWIENNTQTAKNATAWVNVASIAIGNTSVGKWYYGNASQSVISVNGLNTFIEWDDFTGGSLNTTAWNLTASTTATFDSGSVTIATTQTAGGGISWKKSYGLNTTLVSRSKVSGTANGWPSVDYSNQLPLHTYYAGMYMDPSITGWILQGQTAGTSSSANAITSVDTNYHVFTVNRSSSSVLTGKVDSDPIVAVTSNVPTIPLFAGIDAWSPATNIISDWSFVRKSVVIEPTTSSYSTTGIEPAPVAAFSCTPTSVTIGSPIACTDLSSDTPTNWTYIWGDGNQTTTEQNPSYTYPFTGTFTINMSANNTVGIDWENKTNYITVTNVTGFTEQDLWLIPHFTVTLNIKDSTNAPIPVVTVTDSNGQSYTTTNGTAYFTEDAGTVVFYFAATGYTSKAMSYIVDEDATHTVQLATSSNIPLQQNTWYTPKQISITVVSYYPSGKKIPSANINLRAIGNSLQADSQLQTIYGINPDAANEMLNGTLIMNSTTDMEGVSVFTVLASINYVANVTDPSTGVVWTANINPGLDPYTIWIGDKPNAVNTTEIDSLNQTKLWPSQPDVGNWTLNMQYRDISGKTTEVRFIVKTAGNLTEIYNVSLGNPGTSLVLANHTHRNIIGEGYYYYWKATRV